MPHIIKEGQIRKFNGEVFYLLSVELWKGIADKVADRLRDHDQKARVVKISDGYAVYHNKKMSKINQWSKQSELSWKHEKTRDIISIVPLIFKDNPPTGKFILVDTYGRLLSGIRGQSKSDCIKVAIDYIKNHPKGIRKEKGKYQW